jgi:DNA processing protein
MEAPKKSGALITARLANDYGREVYVLPGSLDNPRSQGCLHLLDQGAQIILGESELLERLGTLPQFLDRLNPMAVGQAGQPDQPGQLSLLTAMPPVELEPELKQVFQRVPLEPIAVDTIVQQAGLETGTVLSALAQLEMMGLVSQLPGMRYQRG